MFSTRNGFGWWLPLFFIVHPETMSPILTNWQIYCSDGVKPPLLKTNDVSGQKNSFYQKPIWYTHGSIKTVNPIILWLPVKIGYDTSGPKTTSCLKAWPLCLELSESSTLPTWWTRLFTLRVYGYPMEVFGAEISSDNPIAPRGANWANGPHIVRGGRRKAPGWRAACDQRWPTRSSFVLVVVVKD